jgi:peroxiredoxin
VIDHGEEAPDFALPGVADGERSTYRLGDILETGSAAVLAFYIFDFHPACTTEWCSLRDADWLTFLDAVQVLGIGTDRVFSHGQFAAEHDLGFPLLSDSDGAVSERYGVLYDEFDGHRRVSKRAVFVVDPTGVVRYRWVADDPQTQPDLAAVRSVLVDEVDAASTGGV